ncbi:hypothetical protein [Fluviispira vulneris]|uniref:hypothetical protein n=1 Tax=Fluviispira vulneris TaxID=2763012 RepID=UPI0016445126|nr:hypothetical protein [Fluviispira vulneris]
MKLILGSALAVCTSVFALIGCGNKNDNKEKGGLDFNQSHHITSNIKNTQITCADATLKDCNIELKTSNKGESILKAKLKVEDNINTISELSLHENHQKSLVLNLSEDQNKEFYKNLVANLTYQYNSADNTASLDYLGDLSVAADKKAEAKTAANTKVKTDLDKLLEAVKPILSKERADKNTKNIETLKALKTDITFESVLNALNDISINSLLPKSLTDNYKTLGINFKLVGKDIVLSYTDNANDVCQLTFAISPDQKPAKYVYKIDPNKAEFKTADGKKTCSLN